LVMDEITSNPTFWEKLFLEAEISLYKNYLESMESLLENETRKHLENISSIRAEIASGDLIVPDDPYQMPDEMKYDHLQLEFFDKSINILRRSFFVSIYTFLERWLSQRCRDMESNDTENLVLLSDIVGRGISQSMTYLIKVQRINFSLGTSQEWREIQDYRRLRNCVVHREGKIDVEDNSNYNRIVCFINHTDGLSLSNDEITFEKTFCERALNTIETFITSVINASLQE
ncbi:MAG: hypothetical protein ABIG63_12770, partial [Chloroflexota bacterium]